MIDWTDLAALRPMIGDGTWWDGALMLEQFTESL